MGLPNYQILSEEDKIKCINFRANDIRFMGDISEDLYRLAIRKDNHCIMYVPNQTKELAKLALAMGRIDLQYINLDLLNKAQRRHRGIPSSIRNIPYAKFERDLIRSNSNFSPNLGSCHYQTEALCEIAINKDVSHMAYIKDQTDHLCKLSINKDPFSLVYIRKQTFELIKQAYIRNKTYVSNKVNNDFKIEDTVNWNILTPDEIEYIHLI